MRLTLASKTTADLSALDVLDLAAEIGAEGVEFYGLPKHLPPTANVRTVRRIAAKAKRLELVVTLLDTYLGQFSQNGDAHAEEQLKRFDQYLKMAEVLDCGWVRLWPGEPLHPSDARADHFLRAAHYIARACTQAADQGRGVVLETHPGIGATTESMLRLIELVDRPNLRVTYDPCNQLSSFDPAYGVAGFRRLLPHLVNIHVKNGDPRFSGEDFHNLLLGEGAIDWTEIFQAVQRSDYDGWIAIECHKQPTSQMDSAAIVRSEAAAIRSAWEQAASRA